MSRSLLVVGSLLCLMLLVACGSATPEVVEVEKVVEVPVEVETIREVEVEKQVPINVELIREVEKEVEVPVEVETIREVETERIVVATPTPVQIPESGRLPGRGGPRRFHHLGQFLPGLPGS